MDHAILTAIGSDRPGLVDEVSQFLYERGGNLEDSRMVNLRGQFAMMLLVGLPAGAANALEKLREELAELTRRTGLHMQLVPAAPARSASIPAAANALPYRLSATAIDQPGLVHRIAHLLHGLAINIESLETHLTAAPITGSPMFEMELILSVTAATPLGQLRQQIGKLCDELNIDWQLTAV